MGSMHTIRWRSGATDSGQIPCLPMLGLRQCALFPFPACWGCRIVHRSLAISMALAAVPGACDGLQRCTDLSPVQRRARRCAGRECSQGARSTRRTCCFRRRDRRVLKQRVGPERGGAKFKHYYARWRPGSAVGAWFRACSDGCSTKRAEAFG